MPTIQQSSQSAMAELGRQAHARAGGRGTRGAARRGAAGRADDGASWLLCLGGCALLAILANGVEQFGGAPMRHVLIFFFALSIIAALIPATGPRGQRIGMLPAVGLSAALILPPVTAMLPLLLANSLYASLRDTPSSRRGVLGRGFWLALAIFISGILHKVAWQGQAIPSGAAGRRAAGGDVGV
jgi:hypothetical protein